MGINDPYISTESILYYVFVSLDVRTGVIRVLVLFLLVRENQDKGVTKWGTMLVFVYKIDREDR